MSITVRDQSAARARIFSAQYAAIREHIRRSDYAASKGVPGAYHLGLMDEIAP
jgi:hypothetical protein